MRSLGAMRTTPEFRNLLRRIVIGAPLVTSSEQALVMQLQQNDVEAHTTKIHPSLRLTKTDLGIRVEAVIGELCVATMETVHLASGDSLTLNGMTMDFDLEVIDR